MADAHAPTSYHYPGMPGRFVRSGSCIQRDFRNDIAYITHICGATIRIRPGGFHRFDAAGHALGFSTIFLHDFVGEGLFLFRVGDGPHQFHVFMQSLCARFIHQQFVESVVHEETRLRTRHLCSTFRNFLHPFLHGGYSAAFGIADPDPDTRFVWDYVGNVASLFVDIVNPDTRTDVFPQEVHADIEKFSSIQGTFAIPGICCCVCAFTFERYSIAHHRLRTLHVRFVFIVGMPIQTHIQVVENTCPRHIDFASQVFFCRSAVEADSSFQFAGSNQFFDGSCSTQAGCAEHVVPTTVTTTTFLVGRFGGLRFLGESG